VEDGHQQAFVDLQEQRVNVALFPVVQTLLTLCMLAGVDVWVLVVSVQNERPGPLGKCWCLSECAAKLFHMRDPSRMCAIHCSNPAKLRLTASVSSMPLMCR